MADVKLFIIEGENKEDRIISAMTMNFFKGKHEAVVISVPAKQNIFMLYRLLKADEFHTDIVELIRDKVKGAKELLSGISRQMISEVYLFFDYDIQQLNDDENEIDILWELFEAFSDETENGKLYLSYPMIEALYDYKEGKCDTYTECFINKREITQYKRLSGDNNPNASQHFVYQDWENILRVFWLRIKCLFDIFDFDYYHYISMVSPVEVYRRQLEMSSNEEIFVLSGVPEFLFDYFRMDFWYKYTKQKNYKYDICHKLSLNWKG